MGTADSGAWAENAALKHLQRQGLELITRNYRCKLGELDLIMQHGDVLVFVEVRLRNNVKFGDGLESVTHTKQRKLIRAASIFLMCHQPYQRRTCRFDVVSVTKRNYRAHCEWMRDAFS